MRKGKTVKAAKPVKTVKINSCSFLVSELLAKREKAITLGTAAGNFVQFFLRIGIDQWKL